MNNHYSIIKSLFLLCSFSIFSCNNQSDSCENSKELVAEAKTQIEEITVEGFTENYLGAEKDYLLLDVRQNSEFENGNIEGAVNLPRGIIEFKIRDELFWEEQMMYPPTDTTDILIYCKKGSRGALATLALKELGYKNVKNLTGGYTAFREKHQDTEEE